MYILLCNKPSLSPSTFFDLSCQLLIPMPNIFYIMFAILPESGDTASSSMQWNEGSKAMKETPQFLVKNSPINLRCYVLIDR